MKISPAARQDHLTNHYEFMLMLALFMMNNCIINISLMKFPKLIKKSAEHDPFVSLIIAMILKFFSRNIFTLTLHKKKMSVLQSAGNDYRV
jgi:hypothetical protein